MNGKRNVSYTHNGLNHPALKKETPPFATISSRMDVEDILNEINQSQQDKFA